MATLKNFEELELFSNHIIYYRPKGFSLIAGIFALQLFFEEVLPEQFI